MCMFFLVEIAISSYTHFIGLRYSPETPVRHLPKSVYSEHLSPMTRSRNFIQILCIYESTLLFLATSPLENDIHILSSSPKNDPPRGPCLGRCPKRPAWCRGVGIYRKEIWFKTSTVEKGMEITNPLQIHGTGIFHSLIYHKF